MLGANISVTWYCALYAKRELGVPWRAMYGWSKWLCEDLASVADWKGNLSWRPIHSLPTGFFLTDLGVHLLPTLILLQLAAAHIDLLSVLLGYSASRVWSLLITSHHLTVDWQSSHREGALVLLRVTQRPSAFVDHGVINLVYGVLPPAPPAFFHFAVSVEAATAMACALVTLCTSGDLRSWIFSSLGGGLVVSSEMLIYSASFFSALGGLTIFGGAVVAYSRRPGGMVARQ